MSLSRHSTLQAFSAEQAARAQDLLGCKVAAMMGRKLEEGDWSQVYCAAKRIPERGWSNLNIDVIHDGLGVEHKMLCVPLKKPIREFCGTTHMHPSATRSIRVSGTDEDPTDAAQDILRQYADLIEERRAYVLEACKVERADMRTGWLLWQASLREFLYFEEEMAAPNPDHYYGEWRESGGGRRKTSVNLWVYDKGTGKKRYSITTRAGAKIQPYFDVPPPDDPNLYCFVAQGFLLGSGLVQVWVTRTTAILLERLLGSLDPETVSEAILHTPGMESPEEPIATALESSARPIQITQQAYKGLADRFSGVSDEHMIQNFLQSVHEGPAT